MLELPGIRDALAGEYEACTLSTPDPDVRVFVGESVLMQRVAIFVALESVDIVEAFWIEFGE